MCHIYMLSAHAPSSLDSLTSEVQNIRVTACCLMSFACFYVIILSCSSSRRNGLTFWEHLGNQIL